MRVLVFLVLAFAGPNVEAFSQSLARLGHLHPNRRSLHRLAASNDKQTSATSLPPSSPEKDKSANDDSPVNESNPSDKFPVREAQVATMLSRENKRILIEELGYRRRDVERLDFSMAASLVDKKIPCPDTIPDSWFRSSEELAQESDMLQKLEKESKYPLKFPLLGISLILFGKGFGDAFITLIKVNMDFPGVSLSDEFLGIPVLLIDTICLLAGASLGWWTWNSMK